MDKKTPQVKRYAFGDLYEYLLKNLPMRFSAEEMDVVVKEFKDSYLTTVNRHG